MEAERQAAVLELQGQLESREAQHREELAAANARFDEQHAEARAALEASAREREEALRSEWEEGLARSEEAASALRGRLRASESAASQRVCELEEQLEVQQPSCRASEAREGTVFEEGRQAGRQEQAVVLIVLRSQLHQAQEESSELLAHEREATAASVDSAVAAAIDDAVQTTRAQCDAVQQSALKVQEQQLAK